MLATGYGRFGSAFRPHLKGQAGQPAPRNIQEERRPQLHCGGSLTPRTDMFRVSRHI